MQTKKAEANKNSENYENKKLEKFYAEYKNRILYTDQEKTLQIFKDRISLLNELEIKLARLEKFDPKRKEIIEDYKNYLDTAKELLEENEKNLSDFNLRNILMLKYYLALKINYICGKFNLVEDKKYFLDKLNELNVNSIIEKIKNKQREEMFKDEPLEGIFKHEKKSKLSLKIKLLSFFAGLGFIILSGSLLYYFYNKHNRNYNFPNFFKYFNKNK